MIRWRRIDLSDGKHYSVVALGHLRSGSSSPCCAHQTRGTRLPLLYEGLERGVLAQGGLQLRLFELGMVTWLLGRGVLAKVERGSLVKAYVIHHRLWPIRIVLSLLGLGGAACRMELRLLLSLLTYVALDEDLFSDGWVASLELTCPQIPPHLFCFMLALGHLPYPFAPHFVFISRVVLGKHRRHDLPNDVVNLF